MKPLSTNNPITVLCRNRPNSLGLRSCSTLTVSLCDLFNRHIFIIYSTRKGHLNQFILFLSLSDFFLSIPLSWTSCDIIFPCKDNWPANSWSFLRPIFGLPSQSSGHQHRNMKPMIKQTHHRMCSYFVTDGIELLSWFVNFGLQCHSKQKCITLK